MRPISLDLSPLLFNRTAIFNIGRDIASILANSGEFNVSNRFFGIAESEWPSPERSRELLGRLEEARRAAAENRLSDWNPNQVGATSAQGRAFYLDPLYVLFAPLSRTDLVMCLDLSTVTNPSWHDPTVSRLYEEAFRRICVAQPHLIMISRNTADTFYANFGWYPNRMRVVPLYASAPVENAARDRAIAAYPSPAPYFLFVGSLEARKNVTGAIEAFARSELAVEGYRLYIAGGRGHGTSDIERKASGVPGVTLCGYVSDHELSALYAGATGFIYPSYLEGFGVPLLEAMAFGVPCIATTAGASPEVGGPLVQYRDPDDHLGMAQDLRTITQIPAEERRRIGAALRQRVYTEFSFERFADRILAAVRDDAGTE